MKWWFRRKMQNPQQLGCFVEPRDYREEWPNILQALLEATQQYISTIRHDHASRRDSIEHGLGDMYYVKGGRKWFYQTDCCSSMMTSIKLYCDDSLLFVGDMFPKKAWCLKSFFDMEKKKELKEITRRLSAWKRNL